MEYEIPFYGGEHADLFAIERRCIKTSFRFDTLAEAHSLLRFYFGPSVTVSKLEINYRVVVYARRNPKAL